jgi:hypothetical protein
MIGIMGQVAQWEREQISKRTKAALEVARERGWIVAGDRGNLPDVWASRREISACRRSAVAQARAAKVLLHVQEAKERGFPFPASIAAYLKYRGIRTGRATPGIRLPSERVVTCNL